ncbi:MAG TPA: PIN domain-containing protein [Campylobacterales bacterium]|nr:PIN domain-containing protein [Campylobacterales bacterium]
MITTLYYIGYKSDKENILHNIRQINKTLKVIEFLNDEVEQACSLMLEDGDYKDLEDTIQYILAKKLECDLIISNDADFVSKDIKLSTSEEFCKKYIKGKN